MEHHRKGDLTTLLIRWNQGDTAALDELIPLVYGELKRMARARLRGERHDKGLQTTALVHEAYLRLVDIDRLTFENRAHFFALAARLMRQILVDHVRRQRAAKRGGGLTILTLHDMAAADSASIVDVIALESALDGLARIDERLSRIVELKYFGGLNIDETAAALDISAATVERDWAVAKAWLYRRLSASP
jgi:RNA polymerase sigma factor (TIGR02999 family)